ncbi:MAG: 3-methyl-2-oxobutanoate hydroxymethyltransferase [Verrucomicrobiota bacterium]
MDTDRITTQSISLLKGRRPVVAITAYDTVMACLADEAGVDLILVGDSVGTTQLGFETTVPVTLDMMLHHAAAVARAKPDALLVADIPFAVAHNDFPALLDACRRLMQEADVEAVKIEGGADIAPKIERLVRAGIPVLGHIGLLPQRFHQLGGYRKFGRSDAEKSVLVDDALALEKAGCFAVLCEMIDGTVAGTIASELQVPLIGIGSGPHCDGQILVCNDLLGINVRSVPSFVKQYAQLGDEVRTAFSHYAEDVRTRKFPS